MAKKTIKVTQIGSPIGRPKVQGATLKGLGLNNCKGGVMLVNFCSCVAICTRRKKLTAQHTSLSKPQM